MTGKSGNNRSERQRGSREAKRLKEVRSKGTTVGTRTHQRGSARAMSMLGNAKSNNHRQTRNVEGDGPGRKCMYLTWGDLLSESFGEVSRGRSSEESRRKTEGAKGQRTNERATETGLRKPSEETSETGRERQLRQLPFRANAGEGAGKTQEELGWVSSEGTREKRRQENAQ